jgi:hypothetical protein
MLARFSVHLTLIDATTPIVCEENNVMLLRITLSFIFLFPNVSTLPSNNKLSSTSKMTKLWVFNIRGLEVSAEKYFIKVSSSITSLEWPRGFQEVKVPRFHENGTGWW